MIPSLRHLFKNKSYAIINLFGLTLGLTVSIFILLFIQDEISYDKYLPGYDAVIRVQPNTIAGVDEQQWATSEAFIVPALRASYPEIVSGTRVLRNDNEIVFKNDSTQFSQDGVLAVDSAFFEVFPFAFIAGDSKTALDKPDAIVLTRDIAKKFFGEVDPLGKILSTDFATYVVTGVVENVPPNSHFHFNVLLNLRSWWRDIDRSRSMYVVYSYLRLKSAEHVKSFGRDVLKEWYMKHGFVNEDGTTPAEVDVKVSLLAVPIADIHLQSHAEKEFEANGQLQVVYIFIAVATLIMLIATINYVNLSNAMAVKRAKEVAIRKTIGATRGKLFLNFIIESYSFSFAAFALSTLLVALLIPQFNVFAHKHLVVSDLSSVKFTGFLLATWVGLGFLAGLYPATVLSSFNPIQALKSGTSSSKTSSFALYLRRGLIVSQFTISSLMIVGALTIRQQMNFIETRNIGFNKNNLLVVPLAGEARRNPGPIKNELSKLSTVASSAITSVVPGKRVFILPVRIPDLAGTRAGLGPDDGSREMRVMSVDHDFVKTLGLQIVDGRDFSVANAADESEGFIINEAAIKSFNLKDPVGRPFEYLFNNDSKKGKIIGVIKDFNFASVRTPVEPLMLQILPSFYSTLCIRLKTGNVTSAVKEIEVAWKGVSSSPFSYRFLDDTYNAMYAAEQTTSRVITTFTFLTLIIACLGLFGIVSFFVTQRTREVGIRKVFGASPGSLLNVLSQEYVVMVIVANALAFYPAWMLANQWLEQFAYRIDLPLSSFVIALFASELLAVGSIFYVILKTAKTNPAVILRHE